MNILTDTLPQTVDINGTQHKINTDFRAGIKFETMIQKGTANIYKILTLYYGENIPKDITAATKAAELFYCCGKLPKKQAKTETQTKSKQAYCFEADAGAILSDFWHTYNIDLTQEGLHWWTFRALLEGLPDDSEFKQRAYYRTCELTGLSKSEKKRVLKIRSLIEIKPHEGKKMTLEQRNKSMLDYVAARGKEVAGGEN